MRSVLSARQEECLRLTAFRTDREIAAVLGISEATVKKHVHEACQRMGVKRRKAALALLSPAENLETRPAPARLAADTGVATETAGVEATQSGRLGYRPPPRNIFARTAMILGMAIALVVTATTLTHLVADYHLAIGRLNTGGLPPSTATVRTIVND